MKSTINQLREPCECGTTTVCAGMVVDLDLNEQAAPSLSTAVIQLLLTILK